MSSESSYHRATIQASRSMLNSQSAAMEYSASPRPPDPERELYALSGGQIADLVQVAAAQVTDNTDQVVPYDPLNPFGFHENQLPAAVEPGRLQTRLHSLKSKLNGIGTKSTM